LRVYSNRVNAEADKSREKRRTQEKATKDRASLNGRELGSAVKPRTLEIVKEITLSFAIPPVIKRNWRFKKGGLYGSMHSRSSQRNDRSVTTNNCAELDSFWKADPALGLVIPDVCSATQKRLRAFFGLGSSIRQARCLATKLVSNTSSRFVVPPTNARLRCTSFWTVATVWWRALFSCRAWRNSSLRTVYQDEGDYALHLVRAHEDQPFSEALGYLRRGCHIGTNRRGAYKSLGVVQRDAAGQWYATIDLHFDTLGDNDIRDLGHFDVRADALFALWANRREALISHPAVGLAHSRTPALGFCSAQAPG
jgi:hypothetical protein